MSDQSHAFLFRPGVWLGEGKIQLNLAKEPLNFFTRWEVAEQKDKTVPCIQLVEVGGLSDKMHNTFTIELQEGGQLGVNLMNDTIGSVEGKGVWDDKVVAWEYGHNSDGEFEGYEIFEKQEDGGYLFRSEFMSKDHLRSNIAGRIWLPEDQTRKHL